MKLAFDYRTKSRSKVITKRTRIALRAYLKGHEGTARVTRVDRKLFKLAMSEPVERTIYVRLFDLGTQTQARIYLNPEELVLNDFRQVAEDHKLVPVLRDLRKKAKSKFTLKHSRKGKRMDWDVWQALNAALSRKVGEGEVMRLSPSLYMLKLFTPERRDVFIRVRGSAPDIKCTFHYGPECLLRSEERMVAGNYFCPPLEESIFASEFDKALPAIKAELARLN